MDPVTLATVALVGSTLSAGVGAVGAISSANAQSDAAKYQAQVATNNATIAGQNARYAAAAGATQAQARDFKTRATVGAIEAAQGSSGIDVGSPTSKEVRDSAEQLGRLDTATIMSNAMLQSRAYSAQATNFDAQAGLDKMQASNAQTAGGIGAFTSLLSGASSFSDKWLRYQTAGVPGFGGNTSLPTNNPGPGTGGLY